MLVYRLKDFACLVRVYWVESITVFYLVGLWLAYAYKPRDASMQ